jgi:hypothetical protein
MLNPESVMLNLFQHLFGAGLFQHPVKSRSCDPEIVDPELDSGHGSDLMIEKNCSRVA